jgi:hypothetical protein
MHTILPPDSGAGKCEAMLKFEVKFVFLTAEPITELVLSLI